MSKELEYLKELQDDLNTESDSGNEHYGRKWKSWYNSRLNIIKKALTPPTEEQVCEALSGYYCSARVIFIENEFMVDDIEEYHEDITKCNNAHNTYAIVVALPPHLITMVGRFYEEEMK